MEPNNNNPKAKAAVPSYLSGDPYKVAAKVKATAKAERLILGRDGVYRSEDEHKRYAKSHGRSYEEAMG